MTALTWDNLEEWIASIPRGDDGHFLPNTKPYQKNQPSITVDLPKQDLYCLKPNEQQVVVNLGFGKISNVSITDQTLIIDAQLHAAGIHQPTETSIAFSATKQTGPDIEEFAKQTLANLCTKEAVDEINNQREALQKRKELKESGLLNVIDSPMNNPDMTPEQLEQWRNNNLEIASGVISRMDELLEHGGRVGVEEKYLLNCKADLNQLVPFKYDEAWSAYLISCEHHWMPPEMSLDRCVGDYRNLPSIIHKLMSRAYMTYLYNDKLMPEGVLLNVYRLVTNPECRQYLLRQSMESIIINHAWKDINEILGVKDMLVNGLPIYQLLKTDNDTLIYRQEQALKRIKDLHNFTFTTDSEENIRSFISGFVILYGYVNFIMPLVSYYQVIRPLIKIGKCFELVNMFFKLIQDNLTQLEFAKVFIANVLHENPFVNNGEFKTVITKSFKNFIDIELDLVSSLYTDDQEFEDIRSILNHYKNEIVSLIDPSSIIPIPLTEEPLQFITRLNSLKPKLSQVVGLGGGIQF